MKYNSSSRLLLGIVAILLIISTGIFIWSQSATTSSHSQISHSPPMAQPLPKEQQVKAQNIKLIDESINQKQVLDSSVATKEEISKLADIEDQLKQQELLLKEQHQNADELIKLKQQQLALLEAQVKSE